MMMPACFSRFLDACRRGSREAVRASCTHACTHTHTHTELTAPGQQNGGSEPAPCFDINAQDARGDTGLHLAAMNGHADLCAWLLETQYADVHTHTHAGSQALHFAAFRGRTDVCSVLLAHGAHINAEDTRGMTPLHIAAELGHVSTVALLLRAGACVDDQMHRERRRGTCEFGKDRDDGMGVPVSWRTRVHVSASAMEEIVDTVLHRAAAGGNATICEMVLDRGADPLRLCGMGFPPIYHAIHCRATVDCVRLLLAASVRADPEMVRQAYGSELQTLLHCAAHTAQPGVIQLLLAVGANVHAVDNDGLTPLHGAAEVLGRPVADVQGCCELLLRAGAELDATDNDSFTPLQLAAVRDTASIPVLLAWGPRVPKYLGVWTPERLRAIAEYAWRRRRAASSRRWRHRAKNGTDLTAARSPVKGSAQ